MTILNIVSCHICNNVQEYIQHELTVIPIAKDGDTVGVNQKRKFCNVQFFCKSCGVNQSKIFPYEDEKYLKPFIEDIKKHCVKFEDRRYRKI
jgi:hypothetical protein